MTIDANKAAEQLNDILLTPLQPQKNCRGTCTQGGMTGDSGIKHPSRVCKESLSPTPLHTSSSPSLGVAFTKTGSTGSLARKEGEQDLGY